MPTHPSFFAPAPLEDYELLDSGGGAKLERFGAVTLARPDPQALWRARLAPERWAAAHLSFERESDRGGRWRAQPDTPACARGEDAHWPMRCMGATLICRPTPFKHLGVFPEQAANWAWIAELRRTAFAQERAPRLLNLFAYTGALSLVAARAGYHVTHVDASKTSIAWARENARASGLAEDALRVLLDDALAFARREQRRGAKYAGIALDPPHYGRGPKGEKWQLEEQLAPLLESCASLLDERAFLVLSTYAVGYSPLAFQNLLAEVRAARVEAGELVLIESALGAEPRRTLPCGFCARLTRGFEAPA